MKHTIAFVKEHGFDALTEKYGINVRRDPENGLICLMYSQTESSKLEPIVQECRGVILDDGFNIKCQPFDRFFNYGEHGTNKLKDTEFQFFPKLDGSLIKVYYHDLLWWIGTKSTSDGTAQISPEFPDYSYNQLVWDICGVKDQIEFTWLCEQHDFQPAYTYLFEVTSKVNRVVTPYEKDTLHWLAIRNNHDGGYAPHIAIKEAHPNFPATWHEPLPFTTIAQAEQKAKSLRGLEEGFVGYLNGAPTIKIKSPLYVAAHHIDAEGLVPKRIIQIISINEQDEYLAYFPEHSELFDKYSLSILTLLGQMDMHWAQLQILQELDQKQFAQEVTPYTYAGIMFGARKENILPSKFFCQQEASKREKFFLDRLIYVTGEKRWDAKS